MLLGLEPSECGDQHITQWSETRVQKNPQIKGGFICGFSAISIRNRYFHNWN
jgi:hypothetical protein